MSFNEHYQRDRQEKRFPGELMSELRPEAKASDGSVGRQGEHGVA